MWRIQWQLDTPATADGYLIQEVEAYSTIIYNKYDKVFLKEHTYDKYYEIWQVKKGETNVYTMYSNMDSGGKIGTDLFAIIANREIVESTEYISIGKAKFCPSNLSPSELGFSAKGEMWHATNAGNMWSVLEIKRIIQEHVDENFIPISTEIVSNRNLLNETRINPDISSFKQNIRNWLLDPRTVHYIESKYGMRKWEKIITFPSFKPTYKDR